MATLAALVVAFFVVSRTQFFREEVSARSLEINAVVSAAVLRVLGEDALAGSNVVASSRFQLRIWQGCDAVEPVGLYLATVLASPAPFLLRAAGALMGTLFLLVLNQIRIMSLYFTGIFFPRAFEIVHLEVWQALFILMALAVWLLWAFWALRAMERHIEALPSEVEAQSTRLPR